MERRSSGCSPSASATHSSRGRSESQSQVSAGTSQRSFHDSYIVSYKLGKGAFASVHLAHKIGSIEQLAVKVFDLREQRNGGPFNGQADAKRHQATMKEIRMLQLVSGRDHVIRLFDACVEGTLSYIVIEKCDHTFLELLEGIPELTESSVMLIWCQMLKGIAAVHAVGVVHRDVKPDNFLCVGEDRTLTLSDFGLASSISPPATGLAGIRGTPPYMAPEMVRGSLYGPKVDIWSFGVIVYLLLFGQFPYVPAQQTGPAMQAAIRTGSPAPTFNTRHLAGTGTVARVSTHATSMARELLCRVPDDRPTAEQALECSFLRFGPKVEEQATSLRPMLSAAKRIGAFHARASKQKTTEVDLRLAWLQEQRHGVGAIQRRLVQGRAGPRSRAGSEILAEGWHTMASDISACSGLSTPAARGRTHSQSSQLLHPNWTSLARSVEYPIRGQQQSGSSSPASQRGRSRAGGEPQRGMQRVASAPMAFDVAEGRVVQLQRGSRSTLTSGGAADRQADSMDDSMNLEDCRPSIPDPELVRKKTEEITKALKAAQSGNAGMAEDEQAEWLIRGVYARHNPAKLVEVEELLKKYEASSKVGFYKRVCEKYGEKRVLLPSERQDRRVITLIREVYMRRNPSKLREMDRILKQYSGSKVKLYWRICEKYGEAPVDVTAELVGQAQHPKPALLPTLSAQAAGDATGDAAGDASNAATRTPSDNSSDEVRKAATTGGHGFDEGQITSSMKGVKQCFQCKSAFTGFGSICPSCRKSGPRGSLQQCIQCSNYFQGFGDSCC